MHNFTVRLARIGIGFLIGACILTSTPLPTHAAAGYVTLDSWSGHSGVSLTVSGGGWDTGETVSIYFGSIAGSPAAQTTVVDGMFEVAATVPVSSQGPLPVIARSSDGDEAANSYYVVPFTGDISISAPSHTPGGIIEISGTGFAPSEGITATLASATAGLGADANGNFEGLTLTIPSLSEGVYLLRVAGTSSGTEAVHYFWVDNFWPNAAPSAWYVEPGNTLSFSGSGFSPFETITISEASGASIPSITTDAIGAFTGAGEFTIPGSFRNQQKTFTLTGASSGATAQITVTVGDLYPYAFPSTYYELPGNSVSFSGGGFVPNETITVNMQGSIVTTSFAADAAGTFTNTGSIALPFSTAINPITFTLTGTSSGVSASTQVTIGAYFPSISPSVYFGAPGSDISLSGSGFFNNEEVALTIDGMVAPSQFATLGNLFVPTLTLPNKSGSLITIIARGLMSNTPTSVTVLTGSYYPTVSPSTYYVFPGDAVTFSGNGFAQNEDITVHQNGTDIGTAHSDSDGAFTFLADVPFGSTILPYTFTGETSGATASIDLTVGGLMPYLALDAYFAYPGDTINASGIRFAAGETVNVTAGSFTASTTANAEGNTPPVAISVPYGTGGSLTVTFTGSMSGAIASTAIGLGSVYQEINPNTYFTTQGSVVTFTGSGFASNEIINVSVDGIPQPAITAEADGTFVKEITTPFGKTSTTVIFTGLTTGNTHPFNIGLGAVFQSVSPDMYYTNPGSIVTFTGSGFASGETVSISLNGAPLAATTAGSDGTFAQEVTMPLGSTSATVVFSGETTGMTHPFVITLAELYSSIWFSTYYATGGSPLTIYGAGFASSEPVTITFSNGTVGHTVADASGNLTFVTTVPYTAAGSLSVHATGQTSGASADAAMTVAPIYPTLYLAAYAGTALASIQPIGSGYFANEPIEVRTDRTDDTVIATIHSTPTGAVEETFTLPVGFTEGLVTLSFRGTQSFDEKQIVYYVATAE